MDPSSSSFGESKKLINFVDSHFESFEKLALVKVKKEFQEKRVGNLKELISKDKALLSNCIKNIQGTMYGGKVYKYCLVLSKFTEANEKKVKEIEHQLVTISNTFDPLANSVCSQESQVMSLLNQIKNLKFENERIIGRVCELKGLISSKIEMMADALKEAKDATTTPDPVSLKA